MSNDKFTYTSVGSHVLTISRPGIYLIECWGARGGTGASAGAGGNGGYAAGKIRLKYGEKLYIKVGGIGGYSQNGTASGGFNGGGNGYGSASGEPGCGGGGASDVRVLSDNLYNRIVVAGGGGGGGEDGGDNGGHGGGTNGTNGNGGAPAGTQSSGNSFGTGGSTNRGDGGGGGGGWYGGGCKSSSSVGTDCNGGSGGSGYVLTSSSYKPGGYFSQNKDYYLSEPVLKHGGESMPSTGASGTMVGNNNNGAVKVTICQYLANYCHYAFTSDGKEFYIPNEHFYLEEFDMFEPVDRSFLFEVERNKSKFITDINKMFQTFIPIGEPFYKRFKDKKLKLVKVWAFNSNESGLVYTPDNKLAISYNLTTEALKDTKVELKNEIECPKTVGNYFVQCDVQNNNVRFALLDNHVFYGNEFKIISYEDIEKKGFTFDLIKNKYIDLERFKIVYKFVKTVNESNKLGNLKSTKVIKKIGGISRVLGEDEYDVIYDREIKKSYIRFNKDYKEVLLNKTFKAQCTRVNTLDNF